MKKFLLFTLLLSFFLLVKNAEASTVTISHAPTTVAQQQQFYIDVALDTAGTSINGIQGAVTFSSDTLSFVRAETGTSNVTLWIDQPTVHGNTISFSGIIPGGFDGLVDPFDQTHKQPGEIARLVFVGKMPGNATIATSNVIVSDNDGNGTLEHVADNTTSVVVSNDIAPSIYSTPDIVPPTITASIVQDADLFDGKYALLFTAIDKESGIDHVELKEGNDQWKTIQSPYMLRDQSRDSILSLRAYDVAGNIATITIAPKSSAPSPTAIIILIIAALAILYVMYKKIIRRTYAH